MAYYAVSPFVYDTIDLDHSRFGIVALTQTQTSKYHHSGVSQLKR